MASQTGTLKFRQSDGTYTELYPKTTIAQVDGLQTQLDNINTSLQNKVGQTVQWNRTVNSDASIIIQSDYAYYFSHDASQLSMKRLTNTQHEVCFLYGGINYESAVIRYIDNTDNSKNARLDLNVNGVQFFPRTSNSGQFLATQNYVTSAISGAIAASY